MSKQLILGSVMILTTSMFHVLALVTLARLLKRAAKLAFFASNTRLTIGLLTISILFIVGIHTIEAWLWAAVYISVGEFDQLAKALYFSVVTSTTLGYGDVTLSESWQLLATFEAMGGLILFGASTAFMLAVMRKLFEDRI